MYFSSPVKRKKPDHNMDQFENVLINASEFIKGKVYI